MAMAASMRRSLLRTKPAPTTRLPRICGGLIAMAMAASMRRSLARTKPSPTTRRFAPLPRPPATPVPAPARSPDSPAEGGPLSRLAASPPLPRCGTACHASSGGSRTARPAAPARLLGTTLPPCRRVASAVVAALRPGANRTCRRHSRASAGRPSNSATRPRPIRAASAPGDTAALGRPASWGCPAGARHRSYSRCAASGLPSANSMSPSPTRQVATFPCRPVLRASARLRRHQIRASS